MKIPDSGLAKALHDQPSSSDISQFPTFNEQTTQPGVFLGTAAFMSPEQVRGMPVDRRADIWAFGCVLYEALTGRRAFPGKTTSEILAGILEREPKWEDLDHITFARSPSGLIQPWNSCRLPIRAGLRRGLLMDPPSHMMI